VKLLLDTHTLSWYTLDDPKLSQRAATMILDAANKVYVSPATYWEMAIKISLGKLTVPRSFENFLDACAQQYGFELLPVAPAHTVRLSSLLFPKNHKDPFDRLLVAQAIVEQMPILSADIALDEYPVNRIW
jgi:PIN domain nuclease of toxin-antitoxin system